MEVKWSLDNIYKEMKDPEYEKDFARLEEEIEKLKQILTNAGSAERKDAVEQILISAEGFREIAYNLAVYLELCRSVDTENGEVMAQFNRLMKIDTRMAPVESAMKKFLAEIPDVDELAKASEVVKENLFFLKENKEIAAHLLSDEAEEMITGMSANGGTAWSKLSSYLTSTVKVDYKGGQNTLSEIRNLAYSPDGDVRREAYEAELAAYKKMEAPMAFALNNIKSQFAMICEKRGYESPLEMTLTNSRMTRKTLDAMMGAIEESLPVFRKYLKKKAGLLGYDGGLPWYDLFAPMGKNDTKYSLEEAKELLLDTFGKFSPDMSGLMKKAFEENWIDFYPRNGKEGGAFCAGVPRAKESRVLTNYDGYFGSIGTLAHELGHAYHNQQIQDNRPLNWDYPMPLAETASTFNEVHLLQTVLQNAEGEERKNLLENDLMERTQCILDIYSRYLFETSVFEQCQDNFLMAEDCKRLMLEAQQKAYGEGLDSRYLHPYMWACKSHYYISGLSFYNFPYAFGNLFALGLYRKFEKEGAGFVPKYREMLKETPCCMAEDAAAMVGIDLTSPEFWRESLEQIAKEVEEFCRIE